MKTDSGRVGMCTNGWPCAAMNLEYLAIALQMRRLDRESLLSLDPFEGGRYSIPRIPCWCDALG